MVLQPRGSEQVALQGPSGTTTVGCELLPTAGSSPHTSHHHHHTRAGNVKFHRSGFPAGDRGSACGRAEFRGHFGAQPSPLRTSSPLSPSELKGGIPPSTTTVSVQTRTAELGMHFASDSLDHFTGAAVLHPHPGYVARLGRTYGIKKKKSLRRTFRNDRFYL